VEVAAKLRKKEDELLSRISRAMSDVSVTANDNDVVS